MKFVKRVILLWQWTWVFKPMLKQRRGLTSSIAPSYYKNAPPTFEQSQRAYSSDSLQPNYRTL